MAPYAAYLRIYEPLTAFPEPERSGWEAYVAEGPHDRAELIAREQAQARVALTAIPPVLTPAEESEDAFVLITDGRTYICPWQTRLRSWEALARLRTELADPVAEALAPAALLDEAAAAHLRWRSQHPDVHARIITSTWHVPLHWFVLVDDAERAVCLDGPRSVIYRTPMAQARRRAARALRTLVTTLEEGEVTVALEQLARWLETFHPRSWVEVDYGGLVQLLDDNQLRADRSAAQVARGLRALAADDAETAVAAYEDLTDRWHDVQALERAN